MKYFHTLIAASALLFLFVFAALAQETVPIPTPKPEPEYVYQVPITFNCHLDDSFIKGLVVEGAKPFIAGNGELGDYLIMQDPVEGTLFIVLRGIVQPKGTTETKTVYCPIDHISDVIINLGKGT